MLLASLCVHGQSISRFRFSWLRTKKYALEGSYAGEKRGEVSIYFALFTLGETEKGGTRMMGEGVAKKDGNLKDALFEQGTIELSSSSF